MLHRSSSRHCQPVLNESSQQRLERLLVEQAEMAYPHFVFKYDTGPRTFKKRPDVLIEQTTTLARGHKTVIWHETDEWEHCDRPLLAEVQREEAILLDVNTGHCEIHLICCSPYEGTKSGGIIDRDMWNKQFTVGSVLASFRLILELLVKREVSYAPDETVTLNGNSNVYIYYLNYSMSRIDELKKVRSKLIEQHRGGFSGANRAQPAPHADAQPNPEEARHGSARHAHLERAHSRVDQIARQSQQQQQAQGGSSGTAFAQAEDGKQKGAARDVPNPAAAAVRGGPSGQEVVKPLPTDKGAKVPIRPPQPPKPPKVPQVPQASASRHSDMTGASSVADNGLQIKRVCPCCHSKGDFYDRSGKKQFEPFSMDDDQRLTIELCPGQSCIQGDKRKDFKVNCRQQYQRLKKENEKLEMKDMRDNKQLVSTILAKNATTRFLDEYKGQDLYAANHPCKPTSGVMSDNSHRNAAGIGAAQQVPAAQPIGREPGTSTRAPAADAAAGQQGSASNAVNAAQQQRHRIAGAQGAVTDFNAAIPGSAAADRKRKGSHTEGGPIGNTSKKLHVESAPLGAGAGTSKGFKQVADAGKGKVASVENFRVNAWCPCCGKQKQYLNEQGQRKFVNVGKAVGENQKVFICDPCNRDEGKKAPFLAGCTKMYIKEMLQVGEHNSPSLRELINETILQRCLVVHDAFKQAEPGQSRLKMNNFTKQDRFPWA